MFVLFVVVNFILRNNFVTNSKSMKMIFYTHILYISGSYLYVETSAPRRVGDKAQLVSSPFNPTSAAGKCIHFWYNMYGQAIDQLNVYIRVQGQ